MLGLEDREPPSLVLPAQLGLRPLDEGQAPLGVPLPGRLELGPLEAVGGVLADRLEQVVAHLSVALTGPNEGRIGEPLEQFHGPLLVVGHTDRNGRVERRARREDGEATQESSFLLGEELVAPVKRCSERLLSCGQVVRTARQELQALLEPLEHRVHGQGPDSSRGELDRERQPVDAPADLAHQPFVFRRDAEAGLERARALCEQLDRRVFVERGDRKHLLAREVEDGAARYEQGQTRRAGEQLDEHRRCGSKVLGVVEHEQELATRERARERGQPRLTRRLGDRELVRDRRADELRVAERSEAYERCAVRVRRGRFARSGEREARLPAATRPSEDEQADVTAAQDPGQSLELALAADQRVRRDRERGCGGPFAGPELECRVLLQDEPFERTQLRPRLEPELVVQAPPQRRVALERVRLAAGAVEREHHELLEALAKRVLVRDHLRLGEQRVVVSEAEPRVEPLLERHETQLLQPVRLPAREVVVGNIGVRRAAPERQRALRESRGERGVAILPCAGSLLHQLLESVGVEGCLVQ